jgi:hypothetical protein
VYENPFKRRQLQKIMLQDELVNSNALHSSNSQFAGLPFIEIRRRMIAEKFSFLEENEVKQLAVQTRGLKEADIYFFVEKYYSKSGTIPYSPTDKYNTCDPVTGSFTERLLPIKAYATLYHQHDFELKAHNGFYNEFENGFKALFYNY